MQLLSSPSQSSGPGTHSQSSFLAITVIVDHIITTLGLGDALTVFVHLAITIIVDHVITALGLGDALAAFIHLTVTVIVDHITADFKWGRERLTLTKLSPYTSLHTRTALALARGCVAVETARDQIFIDLSITVIIKTICDLCSARDRWDVITATPKLVAKADLFICCERDL